MTANEYSKRHYDKRKQNGLCPRCGKPLDRQGHYCSECLAKNREYRRENRRFYRENSICPACGKEKLFGDEKQCIECREKKNERRKPLTEEQKIRYGNRFKEQQRQLYKERKEQGICPRCGKHKAKTGRVRCGICLDKEATRARERRFDKPNEKEKRKENHLCYRCGEPNDMPQGQLCKKCYDASCEHLRRAREIQRPDNPYWRQQNRLISYNLGGIYGQIRTNN